MRSTEALAKSRRGLHRYATLLAGCVVLLIAAGALVTSKGAGLSVPDWPLSFGMINPPRWWQIETVRAEHGHRLIAGTVALLTVGLAVWMGRREPRRWVRFLAFGAVAAVLTQAILGGVTVLFFLPTAVSVSHAGLAQIFLGLITTLAIVTSGFWLAGRPPVGKGEPGRKIAPWATAATALVYLQILLGAVMRHSGAGLAIPDFPLVFGGLLPPSFDFAIGVHFAHRVGALVVATVVFWTGGRVLRLAAAERALIVPAMAMVVLVLTQWTLGALVVLSGKAVVPNTLHVAGGALLLASSLALTLTSWRFAWIARRGGARKLSASPVRGRAAA